MIWLELRFTKGGCMTILTFQWKAFKRIRPLLLLLFMIIGVSVAPSVKAQGLPNEVCADCHDETVADFPKTTHGIYQTVDSTQVKIQCISCHGPATEHVEDGDPAKILNPATMDEFSGDPLCLSCHRDEHLDNWTFSTHATAGVRCTDCHEIHTIHKPQDTRFTGMSMGEAVPAQSEGSSKLCYKCHPEVRADVAKPSHHPIGEGKLQCVDCHDVHGGGDLDLAYNKRELCLTCHPKVEGPFIYEHAPVNEDCSICHTPHGSVAENLLKQNEPSLCLNCHAMHFHATVEGVDGPFDVPEAPERAGISTPDAWKRGFLTKCTQCHTEIHGSDLPSQAISNGGNALTR